MVIIQSLAFLVPLALIQFQANFGMQTFTYGEFVSLAIAKVWSRTADFPSIHELWQRYAEVYTARKGYGRHFQYLGTEGTRSKCTPTFYSISDWPIDELH